MKRGYSRGGYRGQRGGRGRGRGGIVNNPDITCFHCQKKGHVVANCNSKKRGEDAAPRPRNQAAVETKTEDEQGENPFFSQALYEPENHNVAQLSSVAADYLN